MTHPALPQLRAVVFDAYGTLFDVTAAARRASTEPGGAPLAELWPRLAETWRRKQLEYTWLRAVTERHADFAQVTADALDWTLAAEGVDDPDLRARLLALYRELDAYPEVPSMLAALKARGLVTAILSNESQDMLATAVASVGIGGALDAVLSVDRVGVFKPAAAVYDLVEATLDIAPREVLFVSANGWDAASAAAYGFRTLWVNRAAAPVDRIPDRPEAQAPDLTALPGLLDTTFAAPAAPRAATAFFTTSDGLRLAYRDEGAGPVLLCLAGLTRNMADFDFVARDFAHRARIVRMDYRGRGASDHAADYLSYNLIREGRDALELLDHLGIDRAAILGTSRGGLIALTLAPGHRDRLTGVCLNDVGPEIAPEGLAHIFGYVGVDTDMKTYDEAADTLAASMEARFPGVPRARWRLHATRVWKQTPDGLALRYDKALRKSLLEQSATGTVEDLWPYFDALEGLPLALIRGANSDLLSAATAAKMKARRPDMIFGEVPDRGHVPFLDEPAARAAIAAFLDRLG